VTAKDTSQVVCDLCTEWKVSNDGRTLTFQLIQNAKWGDGTPITGVIAPLPNAYAAFFPY
jgi:ABC-type transport system substrate-binding protein